jgi:hypothetical protein
MADQHFSWATLERFFRSELSREETRDVVRHLLRQCPDCSGILQAVSGRENFRWLIRGLEDVTSRAATEPAVAVLPAVSRSPRRSSRVSPVLRYSRG